MRVFDLIRLMDGSIKPEATKIHLATWNGEENPLDVYLAGRFPEWQSRQTKRNFEKPFVISLVALPAPNKWLFCGVHDAAGAEWNEQKSAYYYAMAERAACAPMTGRLVVHFARPGRQAYLHAERWADQLILSEIYPERLTIAAFPGYKAVDISKEQLNTIVGQCIASWKAALSSVAGVYLISDTKTGQLYVGSASGKGGIWQRWSDYATNGHGGNAELKQLIQNEGPARSSDFRYSILEIADLNESEVSILSREAHWKNVLLSRTHGLNRN